MPPKKPNIADLVKELADLKKKLDNGGAADDAADANAETDVDGDPQAKPVAGSEETILKSLTTGFEEVMPLMGGWLKRKACEFKDNVKAALDETQTPATVTHVPLLEAPPQTQQGQDALAARVEQLEGALLQSTNLMHTFIKQQEHTQEQRSQQAAMPVQPGFIRFKEGEPVRCNWVQPGHQYDGDAYLAKVTAVYDDGTYDVKFDDGEVQLSVPHNNIQARPNVSVKRKAVHDRHPERPTKAIKCEPRWSEALKAGRLDIRTTLLPSADELRTHSIDVTDLYNWMVLAGFRCGKAFEMTQDQLLSLRAQYPNRVCLKAGEQAVWQ